MTNYNVYLSPYAATVRTLTVAPFALLITLALLLGMYLLIKTDGEPVIDDIDQPRIMDVVLKTPPPIETLPPKPDRPKTPPPPPELPKPIVELVPRGITKIQIPVIKAELPVVAPLGLGGDQLVPFMKIAPNYPTAAAARGIEGFVDVMFDVTETGATENIRIIYAEPSSIFNRSVIQAIKRWKYKAKMIADKAVKSYDLNERITFELE